MTTAIAALAVALLSGMGVGSGGLLVIYLTLVESLPQLAAQGLNLLFFSFASASSLTVHAVKRRIYGGAALLMGAAGVIGSLVGSAIAPLLPSALLGKIFGVFLVIGGIFALRTRKTSQKL